LVGGHSVYYFCGQVEEESDDETITREDVRNLSQAVEALKIAKEGELGEEKASLKELKQDREEYNEVTIYIVLWYHILVEGIY